MTPNVKLFSLRTAVLMLLPLLLAMLWGFPGVGKLLGGGVPSWFADQFGKTLLAKAPGLTLSYYSIALLESLAALLALGSLLRGEFLRAPPPALLYLALVTSLLLFVQLSLGKQLLSDYDAVHDLYMYFVGTVVLLLAVRSFDAAVPPARA